MAPPLSRCVRCRAALEGRLDEHHRFLLQLQLRRLDHTDSDLATLDARIDEALTPYREQCSRLEQIHGVSRVTVYRDINFRGDRVTMDRDVADLRRVRMTSSLSWDNQVSSLDINGGRGRAYGRDNKR